MVVLRHDHVKHLAGGIEHADVMTAVTEIKSNGEPASHTKSRTGPEFQVFACCQTHHPQVKMFAPPISRSQPVFVALFLGCSFSNR